jgi:hypothetical protein
MSIEHYCFCDLAPLYALDLLTEVERLWVEDQIEQGPELAAELLELQAAVAALAHTAPIAPLTPQLKDRLQQTLGLVGVPVALVEGQRRRRFPTRRVLAWGGGAIAAGLVVALAWENRQLHQVTQAMQQQIVTLQQKTEETQQQIAILEQLDTVIYPLKGTENAPLSQGRLIVNPTQLAKPIVSGPCRWGRPNPSIVVNFSVILPSRRPVGRCPLQLVATMWPKCSLVLNLPQPHCNLLGH